MNALVGLATEQPDQPVAVGRGLHWTRSELARDVASLSEALSRWLARNGGGAGSIVALLVAPGPGFLATFLACRRSQTCVLLMDAGLTPDEQSRIARGLGARCIWRAPADSREIALEGEIERLPGDARLPEAACIKLTSGSTSEPAGIVVPSESLLRDGRALISSMGLQPEDRILSTLPMSHAYGLSILATPAWILGTTLVFPMGESELAAADRFQATVFPSVPSWYEAQLGQGSDAKIAPSLRLMVSAGAPLRPSTALQWRHDHGRGIHVLYGSSECGGITYDRTGIGAESGCVGTAVEGVEVTLDDDGLVCVHSPAVATAYLPADAPRGARIEAGVFYTEDLARFEGTELHLEGRRSAWINVKGKKVNPREVEAVLETLFGVREVVVIGKTLPEGRGEAVRAVIVCEQGALEFRDVTNWCRERLAHHKCPRSVALVRGLPRTERGKLDRQALQSL